jgi:hypothetical protein
MSQIFRRGDTPRFALPLFLFKMPTSLLFTLEKATNSSSCAKIIKKNIKQSQQHI